MNSQPYVTVLIGIIDKILEYFCIIPPQNVSLLKSLNSRSVQTGSLITLNIHSRIFTYEPLCGPLVCLFNHGI
jgi:uncharacterized protein with PQ loop repeat